ncbi:facilitated trehalose transporter Tret1-like [Anoplophora glabripennis]|uniref:facilitated trehalose transporter Tret1-like n=1 Tax=Anoplophora glabripennis TaxID=217634 RepID=UPI000C784782|nr:facilitated trehalose transporter Tret1-like [Anoplophora glabripennis]
MKFISFQVLFGTRIYQYLAAITGTLCILSSEMHFGWTSPSLPILVRGSYKFQITAEEASWLAVTLLAGTIFGAIFTGCLADILGRKKIILFTAVPLFVSWMLIALASSVVELYVARFIAGLSSGMSISTVPMYLGEIAEPEVRGMLASLCPVCVVFGILLINILGNYLDIDQTAFVASIFPIILFCTFVWMPESPSFLLLKHRKDEAQRTLETLRGKENGEVELKRLTEALNQCQGKVTAFDLFLNSTNRKAATVAFGLRTVQQFCGTTALTFYCKTIFEQADDIISPNVATIIYFCLQLGVAFFASFIVDIFGRRPLLVVSLIGSSTTLYLLSSYIYIKDNTDLFLESYSIIPILALFFNVVFISIGIRNIPLLMMSEMFSTDIKPIALCVGTIFYSIIATLSAKVFYFTNERFGMYMPFLIYGTLSLLSVIFVVFYVPETKGKTLEDIQRELQGCKREQCSERYRNKESA